MCHYTVAHLLIHTPMYIYDRVNETLKMIKAKQIKKKETVPKMPEKKKRQK